MKIIILGSGTVGTELAKYLVNAGHAVTIIDRPSAEISQIGTHLDLRVVVGNPCSPAILRKAGAENTELLVAATSDDEENITACCVAAFLFRIPRKMARIRSTEYLQEAEGLFGATGIPIDHIISPEVIITDSIMDLIELPGAAAVGSFFQNRIVAVCVRCALGGKLIGKSVENFYDYDATASILAIYRDGKFIKEFAKNTFRPGDEVYFCCERNRALSQMSALIPLETGGRNITISGGSHNADELAHRLSERYHVKLIEPDTARSQRIAERLRGTNVEVYNADPVDTEFMVEEHLHASDLFIAASPNDETNIMSSLLLSRLHKVHTLAVIQSDGYFELANGSRGEIDTIISPREATLSAILSNIRQEGVENLHLFRQGQSEVIEIKIEGSHLGSKVVGRKVSAVNLPEGVNLGLIIRGRRLIQIDPDCVFEEGDHVIAFLDDNKRMRELVQTFRPRSFWIPKW
ncbi:MAG: Trk system potassium transporter TrkA [Succinivibrio sp.]|nr:Trk system potassium transporter TrkA [Succinivibrio sp.]